MQTDEQVKAKNKEEQMKVKKVVRANYMESYKEATAIKNKEKEPDFTEKSEQQSPKKKEQLKRKQTKRGKVEEELPSEIFLKKATKDKPIFIGKEVSFGASITNIQMDIMS